MSRKKHTKHIETEKIRRLRRLDKAAWLIPPVFVIWIFGRGDGFEVLARDFQASVYAGMFSLLAWFLLLAILYVPLMMFWRAVSRTLRMNAIKTTTFNVLQDFDYFRDELTGISPATISMCVDLDIEIEKDITAQFLAYSMKGIVELESDRITVLNAKHPDLRESDRFLLQAVDSRRLNPGTAMQWRELVVSEIAGGEFIRRKERAKDDAREKKSGSGSCLGMLLKAGLFLGVLAWFMASGKFQQTEDFLHSIEGASNSEFFGHLSTNPQFILPLLLLVVLSILLIAGLFSPFALLLKTYVGLKNPNPLERTEKGEILTEEIYGLKNFIRDFSDLSNAEKEKLVLWDDFLIYAVVLEENSLVVGEVMSMRNVDLVNFKLQ